MWTPSKKNTAKVHSLLKQYSAWYSVYKNEVCTCIQDLIDLFPERYLVLINWRLRKHCFKNKRTLVSNAGNLESGLGTRPTASKLIPSSDIFLPKSDPIDLINEILDVLWTTFDPKLARIVRDTQVVARRKNIRRRMASTDAYFHPSTFRKEHRYYKVKSLKLWSFNT